jgi:SAM-dependent methyltransferase
MEKSCWYRDWFNSPYYHLLYNKRDEVEADYFISKLTSHLKLQEGAKVWDLACGKGRHVIALARKGYNVVGTDLSEKSIREAAALNEPRTEFYVHDMRKPFRTNYFDCVLNLFTSIGYFENKEDNLHVFKTAWLALKPGGRFIIDFFNAEKVSRSIVPHYVEQRGNITFSIDKKIENKVIRKTITFEHIGKQHQYEENVSLLEKEDFENFASRSNFSAREVFGNYNLQPFDKNGSDRLIMIFKK